MNKFEFGETVRDKVTGFEGIILGRTEYATGCTQYGLLPRALVDGKYPSDWVWLDETRLQPTGRAKIDLGGPYDETQSETQSEAEAAGEADAAEREVRKGGPMPTPPGGPGD